MGEALENVIVGTLREKATKARELARYATGDQRAVDNLESYAKQLEEQALRLEAAEVVRPETASRASRA